MLERVRQHHQLLQHERDVKFIALFVASTAAMPGNWNHYGRELLGAVDRDAHIGT